MKAADSGSVRPIIIKRKKVAGHGHHGGSWKVAFADFVTAMMAFFLLMWLLAQTSEEERKAIQGYFRDPAAHIAGQGGGMDGPGVGLVGEGGANTGMIQMDNPLTQAQREDADLSYEQTETARLDAVDAEALHQAQQARERQALDELQQALERELQKDDSAFIKLRDQIIIDQTALGLRIQLVDKQNRPMFDSGASRLSKYTEEVLWALAPRLREVSNKLSVNGHTDAIAYREGSDFSNWELSADRANSARRALLDGGFPDQQVLTVQGMGASAPRLEADPTDPSNRRIVILVLKKDVEDALRGESLVSRTHTEFLRDSDFDETPSAEPKPP
jgi:chemotaxis protein MotB